MKSDERWSDGASAGSWGDRGRRDGHHVEVDTEDQFNNPVGMRLLHGKREAIDAGQDQNEDGQDQDEEFEQLRFDHVNGIEVHGSSEEDKKGEHKHSNPIHTPSSDSS